MARRYANVYRLYARGATTLFYHVIRVDIREDGEHKYEALLSRMPEYRRIATPVIYAGCHCHLQQSANRAA